MSRAVSIGRGNDETGDPRLGQLAVQAVACRPRFEGDLEILRTSEGCNPLDESLDVMGRWCPDRGPRDPALRGHGDRARVLVCVEAHELLCTGHWTGLQCSTAPRPGFEFSAVASPASREVRVHMSCLTHSPSDTHMCHMACPSCTPTGSRRATDSVFSVLAAVQPLGPIRVARPSLIVDPSVRRPAGQRHSAEDNARLGPTCQQSKRPSSCSRTVATGAKSCPATRRSISAQLDRGPRFSSRSSYLSTCPRTSNLRVGHGA